MDITRVTTRADLDDYQGVRAAAYVFDHVGLPADPVEELLPLLEEEESAGERTELHVGRVAGETVGAVRLTFPTLDNLASVMTDVLVLPDLRRKGFGRVLADFVVDATRAAGRSRIFVEVAWKDDAPPLAQALLDRYGFRQVLVDVRRMLDLQARPPQPRSAVPDGYHVVQWVDRCPDELVDGVAYLSGRMTMDAPMGDMDYEPEKWDAARYRDREASAMARQRLRIASAAVHTATGAVAGVTDIGVARRLPEVGYQWDTIVDPDHRGSGLGLVLKTWNHALLVETVEGVRYLNTWNAASNSFMIRVNEQLGFEPVESWGEYQLDL